jgi:26S proteasome regulatory subunit T1
MPTTSRQWREGEWTSLGVMFGLLMREDSCKECTRYMTPEVMTNFLDEAIRDRINVRLLAEEHIAISRALEEKHTPDDFLGVVHTKCSPAEIIRIVGTFVSDLCEATLGGSPRIEIDGHTEATFA